MLGCNKCCIWNQLPDYSSPQLDAFTLPSPLPQWPPGQGFASGVINLGELEVQKVKSFKSIWSWNPSHNKKKDIAFYGPLEVPEGFFCIGHYCQPNDQPLHGYLLVARESASSSQTEASFNPRSGNKKPALQKPLDYKLVWSPNDGSEDNFENYGYFWSPEPPEGYKSMGFLVTDSPEKPGLDEVRVVREDLTDKCETHRLLLCSDHRFPFRVWSTRPSHRGMLGKGVSSGTFFCSSYSSFANDDLCIACLKNLDPSLHAMPNLDQLHALIRHYGPTVFFHPDEEYLPSSVSWFFKNGSLLHQSGLSEGEAIDPDGSKLPAGGRNDGEYWIDFPSNERTGSIEHGSLESAKLYVHVKPALGGTFTDIAMWVFCPYNGPATLKVGLMNIPFNKIGQHVGDWEHFTLRISNFTGVLWSIYFSQHSGGQWVDAYDLEFIDGNRAIVYSSKSGHASFPHPGTYIQGSSNLGVGIRNDAARSYRYIDSSTKYEIVSAGYLGNGVVTEPCWLQYMRKWGPTVVYDSKTELDRIIKLLPTMLRSSMETALNKLPLELYGEDGPTGPKEKNNWLGDERG